MIKRDMLLNPSKALNKAILRKTFAPLRFGVATPFYPKTTLCKAFRK